MALKRIFGILLVFLFGPGALQAQLEEHLEREIHKIIRFDSEIDFEKTPGLAVGVVLGDSSFFFSFGVASKTDSLPITADMIFEIGELTQVFTAALAVKLSQEGRLDFPALRPYLNHTSGLPRFPPGFGEMEHSEEDPYASFTKSDLRAFLDTREMGASPPRPYQFSNMNYGLIELEIERATGLTFEEALQTELMAPLGLHHTWLAPPEKPSPLFATGYSISGRPAPLWNPAAYQGALGLKSSPADLIRWMQFFLHPSPEWEPVFSELYRDPVPTGIQKRIRMGYGWHLMYPKKKIVVLAHTGSTGGYMAYMALAPQTRTGVVVLANAPYGARGLGMLVLSMLNNGFKTFNGER